MTQRLLTLLAVVLIFGMAAQAQEVRPNLVLTAAEVDEMKASMGDYPLFDLSFEDAKRTVDAAMEQPMDVPLPKDPGGGYTHEKHKRNYTEMYLAGILYQVTGEEKYAEFIRTMLYKYAEFYPELGTHPQGKRQTPGRLFWQSLNETVWLFHTAQAYDCIYDWLSEEDRQTFEERIFYPMTDFFINECTHEFNLIHNHGTWMVGAVGMIGFAMGDEELVEMSLYGTHKDGEAGFVRQLDLLFSPTGYYTEGPYYVRYAIMPFVVFAQAIDTNRPELGIFEYRDSILKKAIYSALQQTYTNGAFIPFNDAMKEKTYLSPEIVYAVDIAYREYGQDKGLLSIVEEQKNVMLNGAGLMVAKDYELAGSIPPFGWESIELLDGPKGDEGGIGIFRSGPVEDQELLLFKYSAHGLSHGHYDKLHMLFYDQNREIIQDYGSARFINVEQKFGGRYLDENKSWARQTIAHNTVTVDEITHFGGSRDSSEVNHSERYFFLPDDPDFQVMSATDTKAVEGVVMHRTLAMVNDEALDKPVVLDVFRLQSDEEHQYDYPFYYLGHLIETTFDYEAYTTTREPLGSDDGYEHLWIEAKGTPGETATLTFWNTERYYSIVSDTDPSMEVYLTRIGANDPEFNLRNDPGILFRKNASDHTFATVIEPHGVFNPTIEYSFNSASNFASVEVLRSDEEYTVAAYTGKGGFVWLFAIANANADTEASHSITINGKEVTWAGPAGLIKE